MFLLPTIGLKKFKSSSMILKIIMIFFINLICFTSNAQVENAQNEKRNEYLKERSLTHIRLKNAKNIDERLKAIIELDFFNYQLGIYDSSYFYESLAYTLIPETNNSRLIFLALNNFGRGNLDNGKFSASIKIYLEGMKYFEEKKDTSNIIYFTKLIANTYRSARDFKNQLIYAKKSVDYSTMFKKPFELATIGDAYLNLNLLDSAIYFFNKDFELSINDSKKNMAIPLFNLGEVNYKLNNYEIALSYYKKGLKTFNEELIKGLVSATYFPEIFGSFSKCYNKLGNYDSAIYYAKKSYSSEKKTKTKTIRTARLL